jgi:anti-sigma28 factor (negative regulator of flagellin synthesis)
MATKSKKRSGKKAARQPRQQQVTITLTDDQMKLAEKEIKDNQVAIFEIKDAKCTCATVTTSTVHR